MAQDSTKTNPITSVKQLSCKGLKGDEKSQCEKDRKAFLKRVGKEFMGSVAGGMSKQGLQEAIQGRNEYLLFKKAYPKKDKKKKYKEGE